MKLIMLSHDVSTSSLRPLQKVLQIQLLQRELLDHQYYVIQNWEPPEFMSGCQVLWVVLETAHHSKDTGVHFRVGTEAQNTRET